MITKRINTVLASLIFFITLLGLPISSFAEAGKVEYDTTVTIGTVTGSVGQVVDVPVAISQPKGDIAAYGIEINFDPEHLKMVGMKSGYGSIADTCADEAEGCFWSNYDNEKGFLRAAWADPTAGDSPINKGVTLFTIQVEIKDTDFIGDKNLEVSMDNLENLSFTDPAGQTLSVGVETGKFSIVEPEKPVVSDEQGASTEKDSNGGTLPKTGDDSYIDTYLNIGIAVIAAILVGMWTYKRRQKIEKN